MRIAVILTLACLVVVAAAALPARGAKVAINADQVLEIDGTKTFLIALLMPPPPDGKTPDGRGGIEELASAGATFIRTGIAGPTSRWDDAALARERAWQDAAARAGMHCLLGLRYAGSVDDASPRNEAALRRVIATFKDHPGMGAYYGIDEPEWGKHPVAPMERAYQIIRQLDGDHPVWICQAPRGSVDALRAYAACGDATGGDIYPISYPPAIHVPLNDPQVPDRLKQTRDISLVGDFTKMMMEVADSPSHRKPVWMCLQIAWSGVWQPGHTLRFPTLPEQRFMTYQAIVNGARGVIYFGGQIPPTLNSRDRKLGWNWTYWTRVLRPVIEEIGSKSELYPALVAPDSKLPIKVTGSGIEFCVRETERDVFLLACNRDRTTAQHTFSGLPLGAREGSVMFESPRKVEIKDGAFTDWFAPFDVHVYRFPKHPEGEKP
jgi:hypothetical protein